MVALCWVGRAQREGAQGPVTLQDEMEDQELHDHQDEEVQEGLDVEGLDWTWETCRNQASLCDLDLTSHMMVTPEASLPAS